MSVTKSHKPTCLKYTQAGKPTVVPFHIGDHEIPSIAYEEQKFLGKVIFFLGKLKETLAYFRSSLGLRRRELLQAKGYI